VEKCQHELVQGLALGNGRWLLTGLSRHSPIKAEALRPWEAAEARLSVAETRTLERVTKSSHPNSVTQVAAMQARRRAVAIGTKKCVAQMQRRAPEI